LTIARSDALQLALLPDLQKLRSLVILRGRARFSSDRRRLGARIAAEKRRLVAAGVDVVQVELLVDLWDRRPVCPKCGRRLG